MEWTRFDAVAEELAATRAEVLGLVLLVLGGVVVAWLVVQRPMSSSPTADPAAVSVASPAATDTAVDDEQALDDGVGGDGVVSSPDPAGAITGGDGVAAQATTSPVVVHVMGAVARPGVVELVAGDRVVDAVAAAGGATDDAAVGALNMARVVGDGERILVPTPADVEAGLVPDPAAGSIPAGGGMPSTSAGGTANGTVDGAGVRDDQGRLDLNGATVADLEELPGVGPVIAERVIAWRDANGGFEAVGQLREVTGIGEKTFQSLADLVVVG